MPNKPNPISSDPDSKILFRIPCDDGTDAANVETLWAWNLGDDKYKLDNLPYYAYSVSCGDIVYAPFDSDEGFPTYDSVIEKSGNRTIRLFFDEEYEDGNSTFNLMQDIVALGCEFEGANRKYFCINISPETDFSVVADYLIRNEVQFEFADPTYEELYPASQGNS